MTGNLMNQIKKLQAKKIKMSNGKTYENNLKDAAIELKKIIQYHLDKARQIHVPNPDRGGYKRTGVFPNSLKVDDIINMRVVGNTIELDVYFDSEGAVRPSGFGIRSLARDADGNEIPWRSSGEVNIGLIYEFGYKVEEDVWFKNIPFFGYRSGTRFLSDAIDEFNSRNRWGVRVYCPALGMYQYRKFPNT